MNKHSLQDIDKAYVSPYDKFLYQFDATHVKSVSQLKEIRKHQRIAILRDEANPNVRKDELWEDF